MTLKTDGQVLTDDENRRRVLHTIYEIRNRKKMIKASKQKDSILNSNTGGIGLYAPIAIQFEKYFKRRAQNDETELSWHGLVLTN